MLSLNAIKGAVKDDLGDTLAALYTNIDPLIERWANRAQDRLDYQTRKMTTLTWAAAATEITLPADFARWGRYIEGVDDSELPSGHEVGLLWKIHRAEGALSAGSGRFLYWGYPPTITDAVDSTLPKIGDVAVVAFCIYSFYNKLGSSRADYERYSTLVAANGVDIEEIRTLSRDAYDEFTSAMNQLHEQTRKPSVTFFGD